MAWIKRDFKADEAEPPPKAKKAKFDDVSSDEAELMGKAATAGCVPPKKRDLKD